MITKNEIKNKILNNLFENRHGTKCIGLKNSRLDFVKEYAFLGFTNTGNIKLGDIYYSGTDGEKWVNKRGKVEVDEEQKIIKISAERFSYSLRLPIGDVNE